MMKRDGRFEIVTKLQAAERQLWVAIRLFFEGRDAIAVHTLAAAAHSVPVDLTSDVAIRTVPQFYEHDFLQELAIFTAPKRYLPSSCTRP